MTDPMDDAERIAALLDGSLDARQRAEVLARLGQSQHALEAFVDAAAVLRETEGPASVRPRRWRTIATPLALAAGIAIVAVLVPAIGRQRAPLGPDEPERFVALLSSSPVVFPRDWNGTPWTTTRGALEPLSDTARAIRIGARLTDLALATTSGDSAMYVIAGNVAMLLDPIPASAPLASRYRAATRPGEIPRGASAAQMAGQQMVDLGAWIEAARFAAMRGDSTFFQSTASVAIMHRIPLELPRAGPPGQPIDWRALSRGLFDLLSRLGS
ncbi:MAG TPA: hypothetical protein VK733_06220 [Gemmatimonadaceae bacterium]|jgi:hypothetical protein|nr:hypothetical protein [Gemmatimonadaceae bacterium]